MSMWGEVLESLRAMSLWQLLFAFVACIGYALAQGQLVGARAKWAASALTAVAALAFVVGSERWVDGFMLMAVGVAGMGAFAALVWLVSRLLGQTSLAQRPTDALPSVPPQDVDHIVGQGQSIGTAARPAASH